MELIEILCKPLAVRVVSGSLRKGRYLAVFCLMKAFLKAMPMWHNNPLLLNIAALLFAAFFSFRPFVGFLDGAC